MLHELEVAVELFKTFIRTCSLKKANALPLRKTYNIQITVLGRCFRRIKILTANYATTSLHFHHKAEDAQLEVISAVMNMFFIIW